MDDLRARLVDASSGGDVAATLRALDRHRVIIAVGELSPISATAAGAVIALAGRLFAHVEVRGTAAMAANVWNTKRVAQVLPAIAAIRPEPAADPEFDLVLAVGGSGVTADFAVGGGAWGVRVARGQATVDEAEVARYGHALGLHVAAALAVNELMKLALTQVGMVAVPLPANGLSWNLIDYRLTATPLLPDPVTTGRPVLVAGCGSVGGSTAAALSMSPGLRGTATLIDVEKFDPARNPFRYPALRGDESGAKTSWAESLLRGAGWETVTCDGGVRTWVTGQDQPGFDGLVVSSVDDATARLDVGDVLARDVCSVGVSGLALHVQRERLGDGYACPYCEYVAMAPSLTQAQVTAEQLGLAVDRVIALHLDSARLTEADIAAAVAAGAISQGNAASLVGRRLADLVARNYAEVALRQAPGVGAAGGQQTVTVAAPQVSWFAGALAAAEVAKYLTGLPGLDRRVDVDMTGMPQGFTRRVEADTSGRCVCASAHRRRWARRMYPSCWQ